MRFGTILPAATLLLFAMACGGGGSDTTSPGTASPTTVARFAGDSQVAPVGTLLPESLAVLVTDSAGHPVAGVTVAWAPVGGGTVAPASSQTDALGIARAARTLGATAGHATTTATVTGLAPFQFDAVGQVQGAVSISSNTVGALTDSVLGTLVDPEPRPSVLVVDQNGTPVAGVKVVWTASGGNVTADTVLTDGNGVSRVGYTFGASTATTYTAHATVAGLVNSPIAFALTATAGAPAILTKTAGDGVGAAPGTTFTQTVKVTDAHGNGVAGVGISWVAVGGVGSVSPAMDSTGASGLASTQRTLGAGSGLDSTTANSPTATLTPSTVHFEATAATIVTVGNNFFNPISRTITAGDSVQWAWQGTTVDHNITFTAMAGAPANEPNRVSGIVWRVFGTPGTFTYHCTNHAGMNGTITVNP